MEICVESRCTLTPHVVNGKAGACARRSRAHGNCSHKIFPSVNRSKSAGRIAVVMVLTIGWTFTLLWSKMASSITNSTARCVSLTTASGVTAPGITPR